MLWVDRDLKAEIQGRRRVMAEAEETQANLETERVKSGRKKRKTARRKSGGGKRAQTASGGRGRPLAFPKHALSKCLRIPRAILEQNAGKECTDREAAKFAGIGWSGQIAIEISSAIKYGLLDRPAPKTVKPTDFTRRIVRPQKPNEKLAAMREAVLHAPLISDVYKHYRGENLPDLPFLAKACCKTLLRNP